MRSVPLAVAALAGVVLLAGCGGSSNDGGRPVPVGGDSDTSSSSTPPASSTPPPSTKPSEAADPTTTPPKKAQVIVVPGNYASNPAVQGLVATYPQYFDALIARDEKLISKTFPAYFYADVSQVMVDARNNGWVMKPPGSVVVRGTSNQALGVVRVKTCRSQHTQYWNPKTKGWTLVAPGGQPQAIDMIKTGLGWRPYRLGPSAGISCAGVKYPA